jgi:hypothetical protein
LGETRTTVFEVLFSGRCKSRWRFELNKVVQAMPP